jgi:O-antigen/teichoic acid export membrane protein
VVLAFIAAGAAGWVFSSPEQTLMRETVWIALLLLPLLALSKLREAGGRGLEHVICASFPGMIIRPALLLAGVWGIYFFKPEHLSASVAMIINIIAATAAFGCSIFLFRSLLPKEYKVSSVEYAPKIWLKDAFPMLIYGGAQIVMAQTDIIMIGVIQQAHDVGLYAGASRLAFLVAYTIIAAETIIAPIIARLYADSKKKRLQKNLTQTVRIAFLTTLPLGLLLTIAGEKILMIFGSGFIHAKTALVILTVGRLLHVALGPGPLLLSMTGYEKIVARILSVAVFVNIIGNIVLIPHYGINGAAITSAVSIIFARYATSKYAALRTGLYVTVIGARHD